MWARTASLGSNRSETGILFTLSNLVRRSPVAAIKRGWPQRHRGTEKARASEVHSASSMVASAFDAASSVLPADDDVVTTLNISLRLAETISVYETLWLCVSVAILKAPHADDLRSRRAFRFTWLASNPPESRILFTLLG